VLNQLTSCSFFHRTTVTINLVAVIMLFNQSVPTILRTVFWVPNVLMVNIMACRVFRNTIFGNFRENEISTSLISKELRGEIIPLPLWERELGCGTKQGEDSYDDGNKDTQKDELRDCPTLWKPYVSTLTYSFSKVYHFNFLTFTFVNKELVDGTQDKITKDDSFLC